MNQSVNKISEWVLDPVVIQRARTMLVVALSKRPVDELVRILMNWLEDEDLQSFCGRYLESSDLKWIQR